MPRLSRDALSDRVASIGSQPAKALADFAKKSGSTGAIPCWGAIAEQIKQSLADDTALEALWRSVVDSGDARPQLVLLSLIKGNAKLIDTVGKDEAKLSPVVRQALQALRDPSDLDANRGFEARAGTLLAVHYVVPDAVDPAQEKTRGSK